jgi:hypothetical protein
MIQQGLLPRDSFRWNPGLVAMTGSTVVNGFRENTRLEIVRDVPGIDTPAMAHGGKAAARKQTRTQDEHRQIPGMPGSVSAGGSE